MMMPQAEAQHWPKPVRERSIFPVSCLDALVVVALRVFPVLLSACTIADRLRDQGHRVVIPSVYRSLRRLLGAASSSSPGAFARKPLVGYTDVPVKVDEMSPMIITGTLELTSHDESGIFYRLKNARPG